MNIAITQLGKGYIGAICNRLYHRHGPAVARSIVTMIEQSAPPARPPATGGASANTPPAPSPAQASVSLNKEAYT